MHEIKLDKQSLDIVDENMQKLREIFPEIVLEDKIDFERLQDILGKYIERNEEHYRFTWHGKSDAFRKSQTPSTGTLRPCIEESKNWDTTQNLYIEGDNLEVLKLLQKSYGGQVKMIYIDPPYNKDKDFVYSDKWSDPIKEYKRITGQIDDDGLATTSEEETQGGRHTNWLNMLYPRLRLARHLLKEDGVIFISIDNIEVANLQKICNEIFGEENFIECIVWNKRIPKNDKGIGNIHEYILVYGKNFNTEYKFQMSKDGLDEISDLVFELKNKCVSIPEAERTLKKLYYKKGYDRGITLYNSLDTNYELWGKINMSWPSGDSFGHTYEVLHPVSKKPVKIPERGWRWKKETFDECVDYNNIQEQHDGSYVCGRIWFSKDENTQPSSIKYLKEVDSMLLRSILSLKSDGSLELEKIFNNKNCFAYPKPPELTKLLLDSMGSNEGTYLDFFSGSATTAHAVMQLNAEDGGNRKFIMVQLPELIDKKDNKESWQFLHDLGKPKNICEIGKERIRRAGEKIKLELKEKYDTYQKKQSTVADILEDSSEEKAPMNPDDLDIGFKVFKLDSSNLERWALDVGEDFYNLSAEKQHEIISSKLGTQVNNFVAEREDIDMLYEVMLKYGLDLSLPVETYTFDKKNVYCIGDGALFVSFDDELDEAFADAIVAKVKELEPATVRVVVKDLAFVYDDRKTNFRETLKTGIAHYFAESGNTKKENQFEFITI